AGDGRHGARGRRGPDGLRGTGSVGQTGMSAPPVGAVPQAACGLAIRQPATSNCERGAKAMVKCRFCHYDNEDGGLFCEQCKSDLAGVEAPVAVQPIEATVPLAAAEIVETVPLVSVPEGAPVIEAMAISEAAVAEAVPLVEAMPVEVVETIPLAAEV